VDISIDKFTLAEMPAAVAMQPIDNVNVTSLRLNWTPSPLATFQRYEIYRSTTSSVSNSSDLVATLTDQGASSFTDTGLESRIQYYYRVYLVDDRDTYSPSEVVSATTLGMPLPLTDDFETALPGWTFTGQWQLQNGVGRNGGTALVDSPGDYLASTDTHARFAVNLAGTQWPVLRYWDKHNFAGSSWGRVEVSADNSSWTVVNGVTEIRDTWQMQEVDLSQWKGEVRVFIRFRRSTDANLSDGWTIDDLSISDRTVESVYPFFENFENGTANWLAGSWTTVTDAPYAGTSVVQDTVNHRNPPDTPNYLTLAREVDLTNAVDPTLTFFIRGNLVNYSWFRVRVSTNGGASWSDISTLNRDSGFNSAVWIKQQASLAAWKGSKIRIYFASHGNSYQPANDIFLDNIGIGEATPGAPTPVTPFENETVDIVRPTLTAANATDYQSDALTHQFEVYADEELTQLVAQIPSVASGVTTTSWQVDVDLPDHAPNWWRARASDGVNTGPWSDAVVFNINEFNNPPLAVAIAAPANDSLLIDGNGLLVWFQTSDPDLGDQVLDYQIQIDDDYTFDSPEVDATGITVSDTIYGPGFFASIPLADLPGADSLPSGRWFWRIRARDTRFASGEWSQGYAYFRLPTLYERYLRSLYGDPDWFLYDVSNPAADPDDNGVGVLMEFACGIAPGADPGDRLPVSIDLEVAGLHHQGIEWTQRKNSEIEFLLDISTNLRNWDTDDRAVVELLYQVDESSERVRMIDPDPVGTHHKRFIRLRVRD
ncbi:MAG: choice-of-anchor J domain-containing protein, partial [Verrucomicrobiales bacterium]